MDEYISKQRAKDLMGCCLASMKAEYKAAKDEFTKARFGDYISTIQAMIDVVDGVEAADVHPIKRVKGVLKVLQQVSDTCEYTSLCMDCQFYSSYSGMCVFDDMPRFWNHDKIEKALKKGEEDG